MNNIFVFFKNKYIKFEIKKLNVISHEKIKIIFDIFNFIIFN